MNRSKSVVETAERLVASEAVIPWNAKLSVKKQRRVSMQLDGELLEQVWPQL